MDDFFAIYLASLAASLQKPPAGGGKEETPKLFLSGGDPSYLCTLESVCAVELGRDREGRGVAW